MGPLVGPIFVCLCGDQEGNLVQQDTRAFWTPEGRGEAPRIGPSRSESILPPLAGNEKPGLVRGSFVPESNSLKDRFTPENGHWANIGLNDR